MLRWFLSTIPDTGESDWANEKLWQMNPLWACFVHVGPSYPLTNGAHLIVPNRPMSDFLGVRSELGVQRLEGRKAAKNDGDVRIRINTRVVKSYYFT